MSLVITRVQVSWAPVQPPVHPVQMEPGSGVAVKVTVVPWPNLLEQVPLFLPQLMPVGLLVTVSLPERPIERVNAGTKLAVAVVEESRVTLQVGCAPMHAPVHPLKTFPDAGASPSA